MGVISWMKKKAKKVGKSVSKAAKDVGSAAKQVGKTISKGAGKILDTVVGEIVDLGASQINVLKQMAEGIGLDKVAEFAKLDVVTKIVMKGLKAIEKQTLARALAAYSEIEGVIGSLPFGQELLLISSLTIPQKAALDALVAEGKSLDQFIKTGKIDVRALVEDAIKDKVLGAHPKIQQLTDKFKEVQGHIDVANDLANGKNLTDIAKNQAIKAAKKELKARYGDQYDLYESKLKEKLEQIKDQFPAEYGEKLKQAQKAKNKIDRARKQKKALIENLLNPKNRQFPSFKPMVPPEPVLRARQKVRDITNSAQQQREAIQELQSKISQRLLPSPTLTAPKLTAPKLKTPTRQDVQAAIRASITPAPRRNRRSTRRR